MRPDSIYFLLSQNKHINDKDMLIRLLQYCLPKRQCNILFSSLAVESSIAALKEGVYERQRCALIQAITLYSA